jgi:lysozyme|nr:MAG TPA: Lysozyme [Caudoviricetes sp.]
MNRINVVKGVAASTFLGVTSVANLIQYEGWSNVVYRDSVGIPTVCVGHMDPQLIVGSRYTDKQCEALLIKDVKIISAAIDRHVKVPLNMEMRGALVSLVFNIGEGNFASSTLLRKLNSGDYVGAANEFPRWVYGGQGAKKRIIQGLLHRRKMERATFLRGLEQMHGPIANTR